MSQLQNQGNQGRRSKSPIIITQKLKVCETFLNNKLNILRLYFFYVYILYVVIDKAQKTERTRGSAVDKGSKPQSPWAHSMPEELLVKIFEYVVQQGSLPGIVR